jgi:hypothetical protein
MRLNTSRAALAITLSISSAAAWAGGSAPLVAVEFDTGNIYRVSATDASASLVGATGISQLGALEFNPHDGFFYAFTVGDTPTLYRISIPSDLNSVGAVELVGGIEINDEAIFISEGGIAFSPGGMAYAVNAGVTVPALFTLDLATGEATVVDFFEDRHDIAGLGWRSDGMLVGLDSTDNELLLIDPVTAAVQTLADVDDPIGRVGGLTLPGEIGYFVTAGPDALVPGTNSLYAFSPTTGEQVLIGNFNDVIEGSGFSGLSLIPEPATLSLLALGCVGVLRRRSIS